MNLRLPILVLFCLSIVSCGTKKSVGGKTLENPTVRKVIRYHEHSEPDFKTLHARLRGSYDGGDGSQSISISLRMRKNDTIWLSAKLAGLIPLAKALITPNHVLYYNKVNKVYFDGDFSLLSRWLGTELNFEKVQDILIGQAFSKLDKKRLSLKTTEKGYRLTAHGRYGAIKTFLVDKHNFRLKKQSLDRRLYGQNVAISYPAYQLKSNFIFPDKIEIEVRQKNGPVKINIDYLSLDFNKRVSFPFKIPSGYKEIVLK